MREESVHHDRRARVSIRWRGRRHLEFAAAVVTQSQSHNGDLGGRSDPEHSREVGRQRVEELVDETGHLPRRRKRQRGRGGRQGSVQVRHLQSHRIGRVGRVGNGQSGSYGANLFGHSRRFDVDPKCRSGRQGGHAGFQDGLSSGGERKNDEAGRRPMAIVGNRPDRTHRHAARGIRRDDSVRAVGGNRIVEARPGPAILKGPDRGGGGRGRAALSKEPDSSRDRLDP